MRAQARAVFVGPQERGSRLADELAAELLVATTTAAGLDAVGDASDLACLITDHDLPTVDCFELLSAAPADVPVVVAAHHGSSELATHCLRAGAATYVDPATVEDGVSTVARAAERLISEQAARDERIERFSSLVSHELRSPIQTAQSGLDLAKVQCDSKYLDEVDETLSRLDELTENVLSMLDETDTTVEMGAVELDSVIENAWPTETTATLSVPERLPTVRAERSRLYQLFENLFRNAIDHGGEDVHVDIEIVEQPDETICLAVDDDGIGIETDRRQQVFEYGHTDSETGSGIGLAIVDEIVSTFGWEISITDSDRGGARFEICQIDIS